LTINQDILIIQNSYKNVKLYAVFEGIGLNPGAFMDFVKIYLTLAIMGNSWLLRYPILVLQQACKYVSKTIESMFKGKQTFSGVKFTMTLILQNKDVYCASYGDIKAMIFLENKFSD
jgi:hypothetical protein